MTLAMLLRLINCSFIIIIIIIYNNLLLFIINLTLLLLLLLLSLLRDLSLDLFFYRMRYNFLCFFGVYYVFLSHSVLCMSVATGRVLCCLVVKLYCYF